MTWQLATGGDPLGRRGGRAAAAGSTTFWISSWCWRQGLTLVPISAQLGLTLPLSAQLKLTLSPKYPRLTRECVPKVLRLSSNVSDVFPKVLKLSSEESECKPLVGGQAAPACGGCRGKVVHPDPIKPILKAPGMKRLKLKYNLML